MNTKLETAANIIRNAIKELLSGPIPEALDDDKFEMYIPNFRLDGGQTISVRILAEESKMLLVADLCTVKSECRRNVLNAMNKFNSNLNHTRATLYNDSILIDAGCFLYVDEENEDKRIENVILHFLRHLRFEVKELLDSNIPAEGSTQKPSSNGEINFKLFES